MGKLDFNFSRVMSKESANSRIQDWISEKLEPVLTESGQTFKVAEYEDDSFCVKLILEGDSEEIKIVSEIWMWFSFGSEKVRGKYYSDSKGMIVVWDCRGEPKDKVIEFAENGPEGSSDDMLNMDEIEEWILDYWKQMRVK